jgi:transposase
MFDDHHSELARLHLDYITLLDRKIARLDDSIAASLDAIPASWSTDADGTTGPGAGTSPDAAVLAAADKLAEIPGMSRDLAWAIIAEIGLDVSRFPTPGHLVSWAGLVPETGPLRHRSSQKKGHGGGYARNAASLAANGAVDATTRRRRCRAPEDGLPDRRSRLGWNRIWRRSPSARPCR